MESRAGEAAAREEDEWEVVRAVVVCRCILGLAWVLGAPESGRRQHCVFGFLTRYRRDGKNSDAQMTQPLTQRSSRRSAVRSECPSLCSQTCQALGRGVAIAVEHDTPPCSNGRRQAVDLRVCYPMDQHSCLALTLPSCPPVLKREDTAAGEADIRATCHTMPRPAWRTHTTAHSLDEADCTLILLWHYLLGTISWP